MCAMTDPEFTLPEPCETCRHGSEHADPACMTCRVLDGEMRNWAAIPAAPPSSAEVAPSTSPTLKLGDICKRLGFIVSADFLTGLGIHEAARERSARLYHESDFARVCEALIRHIQEVSA